MSALRAGLGTWSGTVKVQRPARVMAKASPRIEKRGGIQVVDGSKVIDFER